MTRINQKDRARFTKLMSRLESFRNPSRMSDTIWRGDWRALQWAHWWISKQIATDGKRRAKQSANPA